MKREMKFFRKRQIWLPTWPVVLLGALLSGVLGLVLVRSIRPFLAVDTPVGGELMVVEGWMGDYNLKQIVEEFEKGGYERCCVTGEVLDRGYYISEFKTFAEVTADALKRLGMDERKMIVAPAPDVYRHRTFHSAVALRKKLEALNIEVKSFDVFSQDVHARRSQMIYREVFGDGPEIGVVPLPNLDYDGAKWWKTSAGLKWVGMECIAFTYELLNDSGREPNEELNIEPDRDEK